MQLKLVLGIAYFGKIAREHFLKFGGNFKFFKNHEGDLSQKSPEPMWLLVNHTKATNTLY